MNFSIKKSNLNFKVYTVPSKPTTPGAENDIAIISSVPMTNWIMAPEKPSGIPRTDGDVWIQYSVEGDILFNALKQNALMIATISAWQYVDGEWVEVTAVSCQNGDWVDWIDWSKCLLLGSKNSDKWETTGGLTITPQSDGIVLNVGKTYGTWYYAETVDIRDFNFLCVEFERNSVTLQVLAGTKIPQSGTTSECNFEATDASGTARLELAGLKNKSPVYVGLGPYLSNNVSSAQILIKKIWLE